MTTQIEPITLGLSAVQETPSGAKENMKRIAEGLRIASAAVVYYRYLMGRQLLAIRDNMLWKDPELWLSGSHQPRNWNHWLSEYFPKIFSPSKETAYGAMQIAACKALSSLTEDELKNFPSLANAITIAKVERNQGEEKARALLADATEKSVEDFRNQLGESRYGARTNTFAPSPAAARCLDRISKRLKEAEVDALDTLAGLIDGDVAALAGDNPNDIVDFMIAAISNEVREQTTQEVA